MGFEEDIVFEYFENDIREWFEGYADRGMSYDRACDEVYDNLIDRIVGEYDDASYRVSDFVGSVLLQSPGDIQINYLEAIEMVVNESQYRDLVSELSHEGDGAGYSANSRSRTSTASGTGSKTGKSASAAKKSATRGSASGTSKKKTPAKSKTTAGKSTTKKSTASGNTRRR